MIYKKEIKKLKKDMEKLPKKISKRDLINWFLKKQEINGLRYCNEATILEIVSVAKDCKIRVEE